ncbi:host attachment protein [Pseudomonadota bacterium]
MIKTWILVANQAEAQVYSSKQLSGSLMLIKTLTHEEGTAHTRDLISDAPGRAYNRTGPGRHGMEPDTGVKEEGRRRFVKEMIELLENAHLKGDFNQLIILAAPAVLGVIRKTLTGGLARIVIKEVPKDVIGQSMDKIQGQLQRAFELK